jgi:hypothetical protein
VTRPLDRFLPYLALVEPNLAIEFYSPLIAGPRPEVAADAAGDLRRRPKTVESGFELYGF